MTPLTPEQIQKVANLANLELSPDRLSEMGDHLSRILEYIEILEQADTEGIEPLAHPIEVTNVFREDNLTEMLPREEALKNAPQSDGKYFVVPAILEGESS